MGRTVLGVLASGRGSVFQSLVDHARLGVLEELELGVLVCNNPRAQALKRAEKHGVVCLYMDHRGKAGEDFDEEVIDALEEHGVELVALAGWMRILTPRFIEGYRWRILNTHPSLLPSFGGRGMYGRNVHEAVLRSGVKVSGCTIHFVDVDVDQGPIILQHAVPVKEDDTVDSLADRVLVFEHRLYPKAVQLLVDGRLRVETVEAGDGGKDRVVRIDYGGGWEERWMERQKRYVDLQEERWKGEGKPLEEVL